MLNPVLEGVPERVEEAVTDRVTGGDRVPVAVCERPVAVGVADTVKGAVCVADTEAVSDPVEVWVPERVGDPVWVTVLDGVMKGEPERLTVEVRLPVAVLVRVRVPDPVFVGVSDGVPDTAGVPVSVPVPV